MATSQHLILAAPLEVPLSRFGGTQCRSKFVIQKFSLKPLVFGFETPHILLVRHLVLAETNSPADISIIAFNSGDYFFGCDKLWAKNHESVAGTWNVVETFRTSHRGADPQRSRIGELDEVSAC